MGRPGGSRGQGHGTGRAALTEVEVTAVAVLVVLGRARRTAVVARVLGGLDARRRGSDDRGLGAREEQDTEQQD